MLVRGGEGEGGGGECLCGNVDGAVGDVEVADYEDEAGCHFGVWWRARRWWVVVGGR